MQLYELADSYRRIIRKIEDNDGELTEETMAELEAASSSLEEKIHNYCSWYRSTESMLRAVSEEIEYLRRRKARLEAQSEFIKNGVSDALAAMGADRFDNGRRKAWIQRNAQPSVVIDDQAAIPEEYWEVTRTPKRSLISSVLSTGHPVPGTRLVTGTHVRIS